MYHPMSLGVIRQALLYAGIPKPYQIKQIYMFPHPSGTITSTVEVHLDLSACLRAIGRDNYTRPEDLNKLREVVREAFCSDVTLTEMFTRLDNDEIIARLHCAVYPA